MINSFVKRFFNNGAENSDLARRLRWMVDKNKISEYNINKCLLEYEKERQNHIRSLNLDPLEIELVEEEEQEDQNRSSPLLKLRSRDQETLDRTRISKLHQTDNPIKPNP